MENQEYSNFGLFDKAMREYNQTKPKREQKQREDL